MIRELRVSRVVTWDPFDAMVDADGFRGEWQRRQNIGEIEEINDEKDGERAEPDVEDVGEKALFPHHAQKGREETEDDDSRYPTLEESQCPYLVRIDRDEEDSVRKEGEEGRKGC